MRSCTLGDSPPPWAAEVGWRSAADRAGARSPRRRPRAAAVQCTRCACTRSRAQEARTARGPSSVPHWCHTRTGHAYRLPASRAPYAPEAQGSSPRRGHHRTHAVRTAYPCVAKVAPSRPSSKLSTTGEGSATAVVNRSCERSEEGMEEGAARTTKRIAIAPCRSAGGWFHVAVNIAAA